MAHKRIGQGGTLRLEATFQDGTGTLVDPVTPRIDIINPADVELVTDAVPVQDAVGQYHYDYVVAIDAPLGVWIAHWTGTINGAPIADDDTFEVVLAGDIGFGPGASLVTLEEFALRIPGGVAAADEARAEALLEDASALIRAEADETWPDSEPPGVVKSVCIAAAKRAFLNPDGVRSEGIDGYSTSYASASPDVYLTANERRLVRRAVGKSTLGTISTTRSDGPADLPTVYLDTEDAQGNGEPIPWDVREPI